MCHSSRVFRCRNLIFFVALLLAQVPPTHAYRASGDDPPTPYGLNYYRSELVVQPDQAQRLLRSAPEAQAYRLAVEQAELEGGAYGAALGESLLAESYYLAQRGDYESAIKGARRGLHVIRINEGLHDASQLPVVKKLIEWHVLSADAEAADDVWHYRNFLAQRSWPAGSSAAVAEQAAYADWVLKLWLDNTAELRKRVYRLYSDLDEQRVALLGAPHAELDSVLRLTYAQMGFLYAFGQADFGPEVDFASNYGRGYMNDPMQDQLSTEDRQLKLLQDVGYQRGQSLLQQALDWLQRQSAASADAQAEVLLQLGDWHVWNDRQQRAEDYYLQAWRLSAQPEVVFAEPLELPSKPWFYQGMRAVGADKDAVDISVYLTVAADGRVTASAFASADAESLPGAGRLRRWLRHARYRPRLEAGMPVATEQLQRTYQVQD
jgi:hypothetical protein